MNLQVYRVYLITIISIRYFIRRQAEERLCPCNVGQELLFYNSVPTVERAQ